MASLYFNHLDENSCFEGSVSLNFSTNRPQWALIGPPLVNGRSDDPAQGQYQGGHDESSRQIAF